jgi:hypothetical protein
VVYVGTCHPLPGGFRGLLQVWQLWQVVGGEFNARPPACPAPFLLSFLEEEDGTATTAIGTENQLFSITYLWQVASPQFASTCNTRQP